VSADNVTVQELSGPQFILLTPGQHPARTGPNFNKLYYNITYEQVDAIYDSAEQSKYLAIDFETKGGDYSQDIEIIGVGLSWDTGSCYIDWGSSPLNCKNYLTDLLAWHSGSIAHNVYFDGGVFKKVIGSHADWHACTYALLAKLHNESPESRWGLKDAQVNILGWTDSNEHELDEWLCINGYYRGVRRVDDTPEALRKLYQEGKLKPEKGEMWRAPFDIIGKYCCLDAEACYLLYTQILKPVSTKFPALEEWFHRDFMHLIQQLIDQKIHGMLTDREGLRLYGEDLKSDIDRITAEFLSRPEVQGPIREIENEMRAEVYEKQPPQFVKSGKLSKNYEKWLARCELIDLGGMPEYNFNIQSGDQLRKLFYDKLKFEPTIFTDNETNPQPAVSIKAMKKMGDLGMLLVERADRVKALSYVDAYIELTEGHTFNSGTMHPSFRAPGTVTGRLSGKDPNLQQMPKTKAMMNQFLARPGHVWVDLDFSALEPVVLTEFSQDENMMLIYGDGRPSNDIYLFVGAHIPGMGDKIRGVGYDPRNPSREGLARAKKECKHERNICKTVVLACQYGAGAKKVHQTLEEQNIFLDYWEVEKVHSGYWDLFAQVKDFERSLYFEWKRNKGYILNGMGRPMAVPERYQKDILNRFVQSTGHDILTMYIRILCKMVEAAGIPYKPIIIDFHDATTIEVPEEYGEQTKEIFNKAMAELNSKLQGTIKLKGVPVIGRTLAEVKEPEE
jgi:DNA polymerase I-like protein with 3'-5' exonuclease and polymerase domains